MRDLLTWTKTTGADSDALRNQVVMQQPFVLNSKWGWTHVSDDQVDNLFNLIKDNEVDHLLSILYDQFSYLSIAYLRWESNLTDIITLVDGTVLTMSDLSPLNVAI